jgi:hypothetical protein
LDLYRILEYQNSLGAPESVLQFGLHFSFFDFFAIACALLFCEACFFKAFDHAVYHGLETLLTIERMGGDSGEGGSSQEEVVGSLSERMTRSTCQRM